MNLKIKKLHEKAIVPKQMTKGSAGVDLSACLDAELWLYPGDIHRVPTGLALALPHGYEAQIRPRSGLSLVGITIPNSPGTIDSDYRGEVCVLLANDSNDRINIRHGDRIAQMVISKVETIVFEEVAWLNETARGEGGFGHTGKEVLIE